MRMGWVLIVYIVILLFNLLLGCSLIVWKCTESAAEVECQLVVCGTIASIAVWLLVVLVCPCFMSRCELCFMLDNMMKTCVNYFEKIDPRKHCTIYIQNEIYLPTTMSLLENGQAEPVSINSNDTQHLLGNVSQSKDSEHLGNVSQSKD